MEKDISYLLWMGSYGFCSSAYVVKELSEKDLGFPIRIQLRENEVFSTPSPAKKKRFWLGLTSGNSIFHLSYFLKIHSRVRQLENYYPYYFTSQFQDKNFWIPFASQPNSTLLFLPFGLEHSSGVQFKSVPI